MFKRTVSEALARAQRVYRDRSGEYARQWLQGRAGKPARALEESPPELWALLSNVAHVDHRAVENFLAVTRPDGSHTVVLRPERRPALAHATLVACAMEARDVAVVIADEHGITFPPAMATLTADLMAANEKYIPDAQPAGSEAPDAPDATTS